MDGYKETTEALRRGAERHPELTDTIKLYCALLEVQESAQVAAPEQVMTPAQARGRLDEGHPLLSPDDLDADPALLFDLCARIAFKIAEHRRDRVRDLAQIHAWFHERRDRMGALAAEYLRSNRLGDGNGSREIDTAMLTFVFSMSLRPFLRSRAAALAPLIDDSLWYRGNCPICAGEPDIAALDKEGGRRRLLCSRCDHEWVFRRIGCPFCGNDDPAGLAYHPTASNLYRLSVCENCHRYLKIVDLREAAEARPLAAERVLTASMDVAAAQAGYRGGGW